MKTRDDEFQEVIDMVIKLTWDYIVFRALFEKNDSDSEARQEHPELFLTLHNSLFCSFCVATEVLFEEKEGRISLWSLARKSKLDLVDKLTNAKRGCVGKIEAIRYQVFTHRMQAKSPQEVFADACPCVSMMTEITDLARFVILELVGEVDGKRKAELERQHLSEQTLQSIANDARQIVRRFSATAC